MFEIKRYTAADKEVWNAYVRQASNATFLFDRNYMDYHADRFKDHSLMFYKNGKLHSLLPANQDGDVLRSHGGLTYGGLIVDQRATAADILQLFKELNEYLKAHGIQKVYYKPTPWIYHQIPAQEDLYALINACQAKVVVRNIASVIDMSHPLKWSRDRHYGANKARTEGIMVEESKDFAAFWQVLEDNLMLTYQAKPVHTLEEMLLLKSRFPEQIKLYVAKKDSEILGGSLLYITPQVVHSQYISATPEGKHLHAIDAIFRKILNEDYKDCRYFDFGTSNEQQGKVLNTSLIYQKEGFGGRGVVYDTYEWDV